MPNPIFDKFSYKEIAKKAKVYDRRRELVVVAVVRKVPDGRAETPVELGHERVDV